jgi:hypothetical protein
VFAKSSRCLLLFSVTFLEGLDRRAVDGDACIPLIYEACTPVDKAFSSMRSMRIYSTDFSTTLRFPDIHARDQISRISEQKIKVAEQMVRLQ